MFAPPLLSAHYVRGPFTLTVKAGKGETSTTALVGTKYIQKKVSILLSLLATGKDFKKE